MMGLLDKKLSLPKITAPASDSLVNYTVASVDTKLNESFTAVAKKYGGVGEFTALSVGAPTFRQLGAAAQLGQIDLSNSKYMMASSLRQSITETSATAEQINEEVGDTSTRGNNDHKVRLVSMVDGYEVVFEVMPDVTETRTAEYEALAAAHMPGEFQKYRRTKATTWQINATFVCRNSAEASMSYGYLSLLRSWTMPYFGTLENTPSSRRFWPARDDASLLGAPPPVLNFSGWRGVVGTVPVVVTSLNWNWPKECDWIPTTFVDENKRKIPFPTVMNVQISLVESFSAQQFNRFSLDAFRNGNMVGSFGSQAVLRSDPSVAESTMQPVSEQNNYEFDP